MCTPTQTPAKPNRANPTEHDMPPLHHLKEEDLKNSSMVKHFDKNSYRKYMEYVNPHDKYEEVSKKKGGKCFLVDKQTRRLALISKGACLVDYHEVNAVSKYDIHHQMFITPLLYGDQRHLNASLLTLNPDGKPDGTQKVWVSLQWRKNEDPNHPGKWDGDQNKCDRYVLGEFVVVEKVKKDKFDCILLLPANHSRMDTFDLLEKYATKVVQSDDYIKKHGMQMTAMTKSRDFNRERAHSLQSERDALQGELDETKDKLDETKRELGALQTERDAQIAKIAENNRDILRLQNDHDAILSQHNALKGELDETKRELDETKDKLENMKKKITRLRSYNKKHQGELEETKGKIALKETELQKEKDHHKATEYFMDRLNCQIKHNLDHLPTPQEYERLMNPPKRVGGPSSSGKAKCSKR